MKKAIKINYLSGAALPVLLRILSKNRFRVSLSKIHVVIGLILIGVFTFPLYLAEIILFNRRIKKTTIKKDPIFIIGHFRSGTTYMHNLITKDNQFAYSNTFQCFLPGIFLSGGRQLKYFFKFFIPEKRPMDNVITNADFPMEDEFGMNNLDSNSFYQCLYFPKHLIEHIHKYGFIDSKNKSCWKKRFLFFTKKITFAEANRQIIFKNPISTVRIPIILELFPDAKFIYLNRHKEEVIPSTVHLFDKLLEINSLQKYNKDDLKPQINIIYNYIINEFKKLEGQIKPENIIKISYNDFIKDPLTTMETIYSHLRLTGFDTARPKFIKYIDEQKSYQPNSFNINSKLDEIETNSALSN